MILSITKIITTILSSIGFTSAISYASCPFIHQDEFSVTINRLQHTIQNQLAAKIKQENHCYASFRAAASDLSAMKKFFTIEQDPAFIAKIKNDTLMQQLAELEIKRRLVQNQGENLSRIEEEILKISDRIYSYKSEYLINHHYYEKHKINSLVKNSFGQLNHLLMTLTTMDPDCAAYMGGWQEIMPVVLGASSSLTGVAGYSYFEFVSSGIQMISNLALLLTNNKTKNALKQLVNHRRYKIISCTYYAVQKVACDYRKALQLSRNIKKIKKLITQDYSNSETAVYDEFFSFAEESQAFSHIFTKIAKMGSAVTLDVGLINRYFDARRASPDTILEPDDVGAPPQEDDNSETAESARQTWLIAVATRGIHFSTRNQNGIKALKEQIKEALADIANKAADIRAVEKLLQSTRSFVDLKHELETNPLLLAKVTRFKNYFTKLLQGKVVQTDMKGVIISALAILTELKQFLSIRYRHVVSPQIPLKDQPPLDDSLTTYVHNVNLQGQRMFALMSQGAVAQVSAQTVLTIGATVQNRINRVFELIEQEFLRNDLESNDNKLSYSRYYRDRSLLIKVARNYDAFVASGTSFRAEDINVALKSIEKGFKKELLQLLKETLRTKSEFFPLLNTHTAAHLCSLYNCSLQHQKGFNIRRYRIFKKCKQKFTHLSLMPFVKPYNMTIEWSNPCFYTDYQNTLQMKKTLYDQMLRLGYKT